MISILVSLVLVIFIKVVEGQILTGFVFLKPCNNRSSLWIESVHKELHLFNSSCKFPQRYASSFNRDLKSFLDSLFIYRVSLNVFTASWMAAGLSYVLNSDWTASDPQLTPSGRSPFLVDLNFFASFPVKKLGSSTNSFVSVGLIISHCSTIPERNYNTKIGSSPETVLFHCHFHTLKVSS